MKEFSLKDILALVTGKNFTDGNYIAIREIVDFMISYKKPTASSYQDILMHVKAEIYSQHPELIAIDLSNINYNQMKFWLKNKESVYGETLILAPIGYLPPEEKPQDVLVNKATKKNQSSIVTAIKNPLEVDYVRKIQMPTPL